MAGLLGLNRTTVSAAYELLESEGLISGQVGRGSFVTRGPAARGIDWSALLRQKTASVPAPPAASRDAISFAASRPSEDLFPIAEFRITCEEVIREEGAASILQLGSPGGYGPLRQYLSAVSVSQQVMGGGDELMITSGCQQALDLLQRVLVQPGDCVALEDPVYPGLKNLFLSGGARLTGVPAGRDGVDPEELDRIFAIERPKLFVVTPNFQNPTGATMPAASREAILRSARAHGVVIVENDIYGELRYTGEPLHPIKRLDDAGGTVLLRSFSKIAFPGLRVGWVTGPRELIARMTEAKQLCDLHTDQLSQAVLLRFAESGRLEAHLKRMLETGRERLRAVIDACEAHLPAGATFTRPQGGMNLWVRLPHPLDAGELLPRAQREGVTYLPGRYFTVSAPDPGGLRLSFAGLTPERIRKGLEILGPVFSGEVERTRAARTVDPAPALV